MASVAVLIPCNLFWHGFYSRCRSGSDRGNSCASLISSLLNAAKAWPGRAQALLPGRCSVRYLPSILQHAAAVKGSGNPEK